MEKRITKFLLCSLPTVPLFPILISCKNKDNEEIKIIEDNVDRRYSKKEALADISKFLEGYKKSLFDYLNSFDLNISENLKKQFTESTFLEFTVINNVDKKGHIQNAWIYDFSDKNNNFISEFWRLTNITLDEIETYSTTNAIDKKLSYKIFGQFELFLEFMFDFYLKDFTKIAQEKTKNPTLKPEDILESVNKNNGESFKKFFKYAGTLKEEFDNLFLLFVNNTKLNADVNSIPNIDVKIKQFVSEMKMINPDIQKYLNVCLTSYEKDNLPLSVYLDYLLTKIKIKIEEQTKVALDKSFEVSEQKNIFKLEWEKQLKLFSNLIQSIIQKFGSFANLTQNIKSEIVGQVFDRESVETLLSNNVKNYAEKIQKILELYEIKKELVDKVLEKEIFKLDTGSYYEDNKKYSNDIFDAVSQLVDGWNAHPYLKNSTFSLISNLLNLYTSRQINSFVKFIIAKNQKNEITYDEFKNNNSSEDFNFQQLISENKSLLDYYWMSFANEAVYKSISAINDLKNDKDIEIKIKPLIDFNNSYFETLKKIMIEKDFMTRFNQSNMISMLLLYNDIKTEWVKKRNEAIEKAIKDFSSQSQVDFKNEYKKFYLLSEKFFGISPLQKGIFLGLNNFNQLEKKFLKKLEKIN